MKQRFPIRVRPADRADLAAINRLIGYAVANSPLDIEGKRSLLPSLLFTDAQFGHDEIMVAVRRDEVIGVIALSQPNDNQTRTIESIFVLPLIAHQGVGKRLVKAATRGQTWQVSADSTANRHLPRAPIGRLMPANDDVANRNERAA